MLKLAHERDPVLLTFPHENLVGKRRVGGAQSTHDRGPHRNQDRSGKMKSTSGSNAGAEAKRTEQKRIKHDHENQ
jgi:hypothetical protein